MSFFWWHNLDIIDILIDQKPCKNLLVYNIYYETLIDAKPLQIRIDKIDEFIRVYDGTKYLLLFGSEKYFFIYNRIRFIF